MTNVVTKNRTVSFLFCLIILGCLFISCQGVPKDIPQELTVEELTILAQKCFDTSNYKGAEVYYQTIIDRYGTDIKYLISSEYEIAHLYLKQNKNDEAITRLNEVVSYYENTSPGELPPEYLKLAQIDLNKINK